jgi:tetratricopeptide (TPR) repeat protein
MKRLTFLFIPLYCLLAVTSRSFAQDKSASKDLLIKAWEAHGKSDINATFQITQQCIDLYKEEADKQEASLTKMPTGSDIASFSSLNNVATCYFIQGESYMRQGKKKEAKDTFNIIIKKYPFAQAWDPRGWYWSVAQVSQQSIKKMEEGQAGPAIEEKKQVSQIESKIALYDPGKEDIVDYAKYGKFLNPGTKDYRYELTDQEGLSLAVGEGIYPNTNSVRWDPKYQQFQKEKRLEGSQWDFLHSPDLQAAFFKWATSSEPQGVKLFYTALTLEKSGQIKQAIKAYYAIVAHFPGSFGWTYWHTPWYIGQAAIAKINFLLRRHPEIGYKLEGANIRIENGFDNDVSNDIVVADPGIFVRTNPMEAVGRNVNSNKAVKKTVGEGRVALIQYENGDWQMMVDGKPYVIRGVTYSPTRVGQSPDFGTLGNWMEEDFNKNGKIDGPYDAFVDKNGNNIQDKDEPAIGDFELMKEMGVNTIRLYREPKKTINKDLLRELYKNYGIMVIMGDFLGKYALGSGASWYDGTDYNNPEHQKNMLASVTDMVNEFKDEPYILCWLLGNENVYGVACNANKDPDAFFKFANETAKAIKAIDKNHPVAICSGDTLFLDRFGKNAPDIDIFGTNAYRGDYGFGYLWQAVKEQADKPVFITEFGCPAFAQGKSLEYGEEMQAEYHRGCWEDISLNAAFNEGAGNSIGGVVFEWLDEWWKAYEPFFHDTKGLFSGPFPDGFMHEEWLGLCGQGDGKLSPFLRHLRKSYFMYQELWTGGRKEGTNNQRPKLKFDISGIFTDKSQVCEAKETK